MNENTTFTVSEVTEILLLKNEETVRRYIRAGHRAGNDLEKIKKVTNKTDDAYLALCTVPNRTPYKITYQSLVLLIQRKLNIKEKKAKKIIQSYSPAVSATEEAALIGATIGTLASPIFGAAIGTGVALVKTGSYLSDKLKERHEKKDPKKTQLELLANDKAYLMEQIQIHKNERKRLEEEKNKYEKAINEINTSINLYEKELKQITEKITQINI